MENFLTKSMCNNEVNMKLVYNSIEITCTVDEFEELVTRGLIPGREALMEKYKDDDWIGMMRKLVPEKPKNGQSELPYKPPVVALYGCEMSKPIAVYGCQPIPSKDYDPTYTTSQTTSDDK